MATKKKGPVFRVSDLPALRSDDELIITLKASITSAPCKTGNAPSVTIAIVPSCYNDNNEERVALVEFNDEVPDFLADSKEDPLGEWELEIDNAYVRFDRHFFGFTQLYTPKSDTDAIADIIAITGLDGHAYGSWRGKGPSGRMWLREFLVNDLPNCRTMTYGYNSKLSSHGVNEIMDYSRGLIEELKKIRKTEKLRQRPIFFIAHSFGGLILAHCLVTAVQTNEEDHPTIASLHRATYGMLLFGIPHRGMVIDDIQKILARTDNHPRNVLLQQIRDKSDLLASQLVNFKNLIRDRKIISFYETRQTRGLEFDETEKCWKRTGDFFTAVNTDSALLQLPDSTEENIPVDSDHSIMVKFDFKSNQVYTSARDKLKQFEQDAPKVVKARFLRVQNKSKPSISPEECSRTLLDFLLPNPQLNNSFGLYWDHEQAKQKHVGKTGDWLLGSGEFGSWLKHKGNSFLWLHGIAGCGKTVLSSTIVEYLRTDYQRHPSPERTYTAGYYFIAIEDQKRNVSRLRRSLLLQLLGTEEAIPSKVEDLYKACLAQHASDDQVSGALEQLIDREVHTYIVIDALDECDMSFQTREAEELASFIHWLTNKKGSNLHLLVTSRSGGLAGCVKRELENTVDKGTEKGLYRCKLDLQADVMKRAITIDIEKFVESELNRWNQAYQGEKLWLPLDDYAHSLIANAVKTRADGMFRLASCLLDLLLRKDDLEDLQMALEQLPPELPKVYDRIFNDMKSKGEFKTASILLRWLLCSGRPLSLEELAELTKADPQGDSFNAEGGARDRNYISLTLSSFVTISKDNLVQFAHQTVVDYLLLDRTEKGSFARKTESHAFVAKCCLSYIQFCRLSDTKWRPAHDSDHGCRTGYMLLEYALNNWYKHALEAWSDPAETVPRGRLTLPSEVASHEGAHRSSELPADRSSVRVDTMLEPENTQQSLREWAQSAKLYLSQVSKIESVLYGDRLKAFACKGYELFVKTLLAATAPPITSSPDISSGVLTAALAGCYDVMVRLMLDDGTERGEQVANSWHEKWHLRFEVHPLTYESHVAIVRLLLEHGLDLDMVDPNGRTALHTAASQGHETILKLLLEKGADLQLKDYNGRTALHIASSQGYDVVTQLLLESGVNVGAKDKLGSTALDLAVQRAIMDLIPQDIQVTAEYRDRDVEPQAVRSDEAAVARTIRLLLERGPDFEGTYGTETPTLLSENIASKELIGCMDGDITRFQKSVVEEVSVTEAATRLIVSNVTWLVLNGGSVNFRMSLIEELMEYGNFASFRYAAPTRSSIKGPPVSRGHISQVS
ncbi:Ankyrin repeat domain-containing protein 6 [Cladobotryum mycophilum]|uniref:Ankyrin repeat domain-containing protein 6 n=1 Tax=Cladobotryum mycophilum TaxID=491253 RepID=A0ABR0SC23_9HYPO